MLDGPKLMGRQAAGNSFLRAVIQHTESMGENAPILYAWTSRPQSMEVFKGLVQTQSPSVQCGWIPAGRPDMIRDVGGLFMPGPGLSEAAYQRLRFSPSAWSLTGITHTICSHNAMDGIVGLLQGPVMPWDALICTSSVAKKAVMNLLELQGQYLAWRFGVKEFSLPQLPVIPLGVHAQDFEFNANDKSNARDRLGLGSEEVTLLFSGRLSFHAKAHPYPMLIALQEVAAKTNKALRLLLCGQFPNDAVRDAFINGAAQFAPSVRVNWVDGKNFSDYTDAWAASDIFISLADNLQETFGITPLEAMASGLPVVVSDWDGYKDTVVDGVSGFRIPTWMPPPDLGSALAASFESGAINYDKYIGLACLEVSLDHNVLVDRLTRLVLDKNLRALMGESGRKRVAMNYEWRVLMPQYLSLWSDLDERRNHASIDAKNKSNSAPRAAPARQDPYKVFSSFPTAMIAPHTIVVAGNSNATNWQALCTNPLFDYAKDFLPENQDVLAITSILGERQSVAEIAQKAGISLAKAIKVLAPMAKANLVVFHDTH